MKKWIKLFCIEVLQKMNKKYSQVLSYSIPEFNVDVQPDRCNNNSNELNSTVAKTSSKKSPMPTRKNTYLLSDECNVRMANYGPSFFLPFMAQVWSALSARAMQTRKEKNEDPQLAVQTEQTRLIRCLLYGFVDYSGKGTK